MCVCLTAQARDKLDLQSNVRMAAANCDGAPPGRAVASATPVGYDGTLLAEICYHQSHRRRCCSLLSSEPTSLRNRNIWL
jgi:hypothetical protein